MSKKPKVRKEPKEITLSIVRNIEEKTRQDFARIKERVQTALEPMAGAIKKYQDDLKRWADITNRQEIVIELPNNRKRFLEVFDDHIFENGESIDFPNSNEEYVMITKFLISQMGDGESCLYEYKALIKEFGKTKEKKEDTKMRIHNAIQTLYRSRKRQERPFPKRTPDGRKVIAVEHGVGIRICNPWI